MPDQADRDKRKIAKDLVTQGGEEILASLGKAKNILKASVVAGVFATQLIEDDPEDPTLKLRKAGSILGKSILKGIKAGVAESMKGIVSGGTKIADVIKQELDDDSDKDIDNNTDGYEITDE